METFIIIVLIMLIIFVALMPSRKLSPEAEKQLDDRLTWGEVNPVLICPHCQTKGNVRTKFVSLKKGISGAKATGAIFTAGLSLFAIGLSRKEESTQAHCSNCNSTWHFN